MKRVRFQIGAVGFVLIAALVVAAIPTRVSLAGNSPVLSITRFRVSTSGQYFELKSGEESVDMSRVQLAYYNHYDLTKATSSKLVSLSGQLEPNAFYLVNDSALTLCYQQTVASASLSFSSTAGMVQVLYLHQTEVGGQFTSTVLDSVAWSRTAVSNPNVQTLPSSDPTAFLQRSGSAWTVLRPSTTDACTYEYETTNEVAELEEDYVFLSSAMPPVRYVASAVTASGKVNRNVGKMAPVVNELLPNPASPQTDADDEFIELYNPNDSDFDLSGFKLAFGSAKPKKYTFPEGTILKPKEFKAFTSGDTSISLSNTEAQVWLLDPNEKVIGQSDPYAKAKDGQAWALDNGKWLWTTRPTPNEMNAISPVVTADSKSKTAAATLGISGTADGNSSGSGGANAAQSLDDAAPLHPSVLAVVGIAAVGYALYEYRQDIANRYHQLRRYLRHRRTVRTPVQGR